MPHLPELTESDIREWTDTASFQRGQSYFRQGSILDPRRQGMTLRAQCLGSRSQPYRVEVTSDSEGISSGHCSCPVGAGGHCKHVAALLLTWMNDPDNFLETEDPKRTLEQRSKEELIELIRKMITRYPDLEILLELPSPEAGGAWRPVDPEIIRRQVQSAFYGAGDDWGASWDISQQLEDLLKLAHNYAEGEDRHNAVAVYRTIAKEVLDEYDTFQDEEGELGEIVNECVRGLKPCLAMTEDPQERETILRALFEIYCWDVNSGGYGIGDEVPEIIIEMTTSEEKRQIAQWVRALLPSGSSWQNEAYGGFLLDLEAEDMDDETYLKTCRETGRLQDLVDRLLKLERLEEAETEARQAGDYDLLRLTELFVAYDHGDLAEKLVRKRIKFGKDHRLTEWLKEWVLKRGDVAEALNLSQQIFQNYPSLDGYKEIKSLAQKIQQWESLRPEMLDRLAREKNHGLLTEIHLLEKEFDQALETVKHASDRYPFFGGSALTIKVARAVEKTHPHEAIGIYKTEAERLINHRGRSNYAEAASYLVRVKELYKQLSDEKTWEAFIRDLRTQNNRLPALKDELKRAGL